MIDEFTHERISPYCPFKSNQRQAKTLILTPRCAVWLRGVMHSAEIDSGGMGCTVHTREFLKNFSILAKSKKEFENTLACLTH